MKTTCKTIGRLYTTERKLIPAGTRGVVLRKRDYYGLTVVDIKTKLGRVTCNERRIEYENHS